MWKIRIFRKKSRRSSMKVRKPNQPGAVDALTGTQVRCLGSPANPRPRIAAGTVEPSVALTPSPRGSARKTEIWGTVHSSDITRGPQEPRSASRRCPSHVPDADRPPCFGGLAVSGGNCGDYALFPQPPGLLALLPNDIANSRLGGSPCTPMPRTGATEISSAGAT